MILIFGGTTEGRIAARVCDKAAKRFFYSTRGEEQQLLATYAQRVMGAMDSEQILSFIAQHEIKLIINAAHPFAKILHENIGIAAHKYNIPIIRLDRLEQVAEYDRIRYFDSMDEVVDFITSKNLKDILALTGVKSAGTLSPIATTNRVSLRIMDREESHREIEKSAFPEENIILYDLLNSSDEQNDFELCRCLNIRYLIIKDSGLTGGFSAKVELAKALKIPLFIIKRPVLPPCRATVYGEFGLRRTIEELLPSFFDLRTGFTTGSAATAASVAALSALTNENAESSVEIYLPNGEPITIPINETKVTSSHSAESSVIKDGGDDPDATHNIEIIAKVTLCDYQPSTIIIRGGKGVGKVTLPGIGIEVGKTAINPIPRAMIETNVKRIAMETKIDKSILIEIEVPKGEAIGAKTFNPRLGIFGGISILGTSGIVQPFSSEAFLESIERQIMIVKALGYNTIAINSGAMSERYIKAHLPHLPQPCYIHYGNLIGATIELVSREGVEHLFVGCMIGKAVKLAKGALDTHSKNTVIDRDFIVELAIEASCSAETLQRISELITARELWSIIPQRDTHLFDVIAQHCFNHCKPLFPTGVLEFLLINESGKIAAVVKG